MWLRIVGLSVVLATTGGCVFNGPLTTRRFVLERHPLRGKQAVLTVSGRTAPPAHEVHRARLNHGAVRACRPPRSALPWLPGAIDWLLNRSGDAPGRCGAGRVCEGAADCVAAPIPPPFDEPVQ